MDCFQDFCLGCDKESTSGPYCSQSCRLADLERANHSVPSSPTSPCARTSQPSSSGYVLAPAYDFTSKPISDGRSTRNSYFMWTPAHQTAQASEALNRVLTPSSSRSSLSSTASASSMACHGGLSEQAKRELQEYFNSFDQTRAAKRRTSLK